MIDRNNYATAEVGSSKIVPPAMIINYASAGAAATTSANKEELGSQNQNLKVKQKRVANDSPKRHQGYSSSFVPGNSTIGLPGFSSSSNTNLFHSMPAIHHGKRINPSTQTTAAINTNS